MAGRFISVSTRLALATVVIVALACAFVVLELTRHERDQLIDAKRVAASMVADLFAASAAPALDFDDAEALASELSALRSNAEVTYASIWTLEQQQPKAELGSRAPATDAPRPEQTTATRVESDHIDAIRPLHSPSGKLLGTALLRFSLARENAEYRAIRDRILWYSLALSAGLAIFLIAITRRTVVHPLGRLVKAAQGLEQGERRRVGITSNDEVGRLGSAFDRMADAIADREQSLAKERGRLQALLDHMAQSIVVFAPTGEIQDERSRRTDTFFGSAAAPTTHVADLLYPQAGDDRVDREAFVEWLQLLEGSGEADWTELSELAPREAVVQTADGEQRVFELEFRPVVEQDRIVRVMLLATDVSVERRLERAVRTREAEHKKQIAAMRRLVAGGGQLFVRFLQNARERIARARQLVQEQVELTRATVESLFQTVHTLKGEAKSLDLGAVDAELRQSEEYLSELRVPERLLELDRDGSARRWLRDALDRVQSELDAAEQLFVEQ